MGFEVYPSETNKIEFLTAGLKSLFSGGGGTHYTKVNFAVPFGFDRSLCSELGNTRQRNQTNIGWNFIEFVIK